VAVSQLIGGLVSIPAVSQGIDSAAGWFSGEIQANSNISFSAVTDVQNQMVSQLQLVDQQMQNNIDMIYYMQYEIYSLWEDEQQLVAMTTNQTVSVETVMKYIQANGLQVSERWRLAEEDDTGALYIRDLLASTEGIDARYKLRNGTYVNL